MAGAAAVAGIVTALVSTGVGVQQSQAGERRAEHQEQTQENLQKKAKHEQEQKDMAQAQAAVRARQRTENALSSTYRPDVSTNLLGSVGAAGGKQSTLLGM